MPEFFDVIFKGATIVNQNGAQGADIGVKDGIIAAIDKLEPKQADKSIDCTGLHILPGVIDTHVHFREPGATYKEDLQSGSQAAVLGGVTAIFDMPNTKPATTSATALEAKVEAARQSMYCDFAFWVGATKENITVLPHLENLAVVAGIKVFMGSSTGDLLISDDATLRQVLKHTKRRVAFHSEDEELLQARKDLQKRGNGASHSVWRGSEVALSSTQRLIKIAQETKALIHILHLSTLEEIDFLRYYKDLATIEVTPHHLMLSSEDYEKLGTLIQMNPPLRGLQHQQALWKGVQNGMVDVIGSDHAPHSLQEKQQPYPLSPSGIVGVQTTLPLLLDAVSRGNLTLERLVDLTSHGPQRVFGIAKKGRLAVGYDADLTIVDLQKEATISNAQIRSKVGWTPYAGRKVKGWVKGTVIRGDLVMWEEKILCKPQAKEINFLRKPCARD